MADDMKRRSLRTIGGARRITPPEASPLTRSAAQDAPRARSIALRTSAKHPTNHALEAVAATPDDQAPEGSLSVLEAPSSTPLNAGMKLSSQAPPSCQK